MLRGHVAAWLTAVFAVLLLLLTVSDAPNAALGTALLLLGGLAAFALFFATERAVHRSR